MLIYTPQAITQKLIGPFIAENSKYEQRKQALYFIYPLLRLGVVLVSAAIELIFFFISIIVFIIIISSSIIIIIIN